MVSPFYKTRLVFKISAHIQQARTSLLEDLVAYTNDPIRYKRRMRMLTQLAGYEQDILKKIENFETNDISDLDGYDSLELLKQEVNLIVNRDS